MFILRRTTVFTIVFIFSVSVVAVSNTELARRCTAVDQPCDLQTTDSCCPPYVCTQEDLENPGFGVGVDITSSLLLLINFIGEVLLLAKLARIYS